MLALPIGEVGQLPLNLVQNMDKGWARLNYQEPELLGFALHQANAG